MIQSIQAKFKPTPADYVKATLAFYFTQRSILLLVAVSVVFVLLAVPYSLIQWANGSNIAIFILAIALGFLLIAAATVATPLMRVRKMVDHDETMRAETVWSIKNDRIELRNHFEKTELAWEMFDRLIDTRQYFLLVYAANKRQFTFLPKQAFSNKNESDRFVVLAHANIANRR
ncbi:MAG TPA: YcxB family protein [Longilinea sp.]|nr:YcxB family protein [Longilinea sp.]